MAVNIVQDYGPILMSFERIVFDYYGENPDLKDPHVIDAYAQLLLHYTRKRKRLPELPTRLGGHALTLFTKLQEETEKLANEYDNTAEGAMLIYGISMACFKKLLDSAQFWHKKDGFRGYLKYVEQFMTE